MTKALTVTFLETVKPGAKRREIPDGVVSGLYLIVQPSGKASWAVRYRAAGRPRKLTLGGHPGIGLRAARELASRTLVEVAGGSDPGAEKKAARAATRERGDSDFVENVVSRFIERYAKANTRTRTWVETERVLKQEVAARWKGRRLSSVTRADVHEMLDSIVDRGAPILANRALALFRRMCNWAVERGIIDTSPCDRVKAPAPVVNRDRVLSDDELKNLWGACDALGWPFGPLVQLLILTGQRRSEISEMRWAEVDLAAATWTLPRERVKNDQEHVVPLSDAAIAILQRLPHVAGSHYVFTHGAKPVAGFNNVKRRLDALMPAGTPAWVFHDLRRTFASGCARLGVNLPVIEKLLNHVSGSFAGVVGVYQKHSFANEKTAAMQLWARHVEAILRGKAASNVVELRA